MFLQIRLAVHLQHGPPQEDATTTTTDAPGSHRRIMYTKPVYVTTVTNCPVWAVYWGGFGVKLPSQGQRRQLGRKSSLYQPCSAQWSGPKFR